MISRRRLKFWRIFSPIMAVVIADLARFPMVFELKLYFAEVSIIWLIFTGLCWFAVPKENIT